MTAAEATTAETMMKKKRFFRKPDLVLWIGTGLALVNLVWCLLFLLLTVSGPLLNDDTFGCMKSIKDFVASRLRDEAHLVYVWTGLSFLFCALMLLEFWRKKGYYLKALFGAPGVLVLIMSLTFYFFVTNETKEIEEFKNHQYAQQVLKAELGGLENQTTDGACDILNNVFRWQTEFKCCGLQGYQDWNSSVPDSCLCDRGDGSSGCVKVGNSFIYEKPCLPTVFSLMEKRSFTFRAVMITWIVLAAAPFVIIGLITGFFCFEYHCLDELCYCLYKMRGGEDMVPVVFIRQDNNNQPAEEDGKSVEGKESNKDDSVVVDVTDSTTVPEKEVKEIENDNAVWMIRKSEWKRLQEKLDPPPVQHAVHCTCIDSRTTRYLYKVLLEEGSPLLPAGAVLVDVNKPTRDCLWAEGHHLFLADRLVWPRE